MQIHDPLTLLFWPVVIGGCVLAVAVYRWLGGKNLDEQRKDNPDRDPSAGIGCEWLVVLILVLWGLLQFGIK